VTATKLMKVYRYLDGKWEAQEPNFTDYTFEIWNGTHEDEVVMAGFEDGGNREVRIVVKGDQFGDTIEDETSRFSAACKWGYAHAVLYGDPSTPHDPYIVVLEIAEGTFEEDEHVSPYPYMVIAHVVFADHVVFLEGFPNLGKLMGELRPLVGGGKPQDIDLYDLHKFAVNYGWQ
jgi:hypothetical protein